MGENYHAHIVDVNTMPWWYRRVNTAIDRETRLRREVAPQERSATSELRRGTLLRSRRPAMAKNSEEPRQKVRS